MLIIIRGSGQRQGLGKKRKEEKGKEKNLNFLYGCLDLKLISVLFLMFIRNFFVENKYILNFVVEKDDFRNGLYIF